MGKAIEVLYKLLNEDGTASNGGTAEWFLPKGKRPGKWMPRLKNLVPCKHGYHVCRTKDLLCWYGKTLYAVEVRGARRTCDDKVVVGQARLLSRVAAWNERTLRLFACDCAEHVLPIFEQAHPDDNRPREAIRAGRLYATGQGTSEQLRAAGAAARAATDAATYAADAATYAARAATYAATYAAGAAAYDAGAATDAAGAARAATYAADAPDAAYAAEYNWQVKRLSDYLNGKRGAQ
jgi:hypothetical protein